MKATILIAVAIVLGVCGTASAQAEKKDNANDPFPTLEEKLRVAREADLAFEKQSKDASAKREKATASAAAVEASEAALEAANEQVAEAEKAVAEAADGDPKTAAEAALQEVQKAADEASKAHDDATYQARRDGEDAEAAEALLKDAQTKKDEAEAGAVDAAIKAADANNQAKLKLAQKPKTGVDAYLEARCASALCFEKNWIGIEPLIELPIAKSFAIGNSSLAQYVNNHDITLQLAAGIRVWAFRDLISIASYLSVPLSSSGVRVEGSEFTYPGASIRRPYPGVAIGLLYDIVWIGFDHDELRNGDSSDASAYNPEYPANGRVSSCTTISVALQPVTAARALFGAVRNETKDEEGD